MLSGPQSMMYHATEPCQASEEPTDALESDQKSTLTLQEKVFTKLLQEETNMYCFDCGWPDPTHVSINHGIFLCINCATGLHIEHYPIEVSYIKSIADDSFNYL